MNIKLLIAGLLLTASCGHKQDNAGKTATAAQQPAMVAQARPAPVPGNWETYCNHKYGYCIAYDTLLLDAQPEADAGDGRVFLDKTGKEFLKVYWRNNSDPDIGISSLEKLVSEEEWMKQANTTYRKTGQNMAVISGTKQEMIYYTKIITTGKDVAFAEFQYAAKDKVKYDTIVSRMAGSFQPAGTWKPE